MALVKHRDNFTFTLPACSMTTRLCLSPVAGIKELPIEVLRHQTRHRVTAISLDPIEPQASMGQAGWFSVHCEVGSETNHDGIMTLVNSSRTCIDDESDYAKK
jgi:hypothetical protein